MTANRTAALAAALTGLAAFVAGLADVLPGGAWPNYALAASGLLVKLTTVVTFLTGAQRWDALTMGRETALLRAVGSGHEIPGRTEGTKADGYASADEPPGAASTAPVVTPAPPTTS